MKKYSIYAKELQGQTSATEDDRLRNRTVVSSSNCSEGQMRIYKITHGPHYDCIRAAL